MSLKLLAVKEQIHTVDAKGKKKHFLFVVSTCNFKRRAMECVREELYYRMATVNDERSSCLVRWILPECFHSIR